jgi:hypothetical protein
MNLQQVIDKLELTVLTDKKDFNTIVPSDGYSSDLLSCVMTGAPHGGLWITLQAHINIVAVAALLEISAVIITEGAFPDANTIKKANEEGITLLSTPTSSYVVCGKLWELGLRGKQ